MTVLLFRILCVIQVTILLLVHSVYATDVTDLNVLINTTSAKDANSNDDLRQTSTNKTPAIVLSDPQNDTAEKRYQEDLETLLNHQPDDILKDVSSYRKNILRTTMPPTRVTTKCPTIKRKKRIMERQVAQGQIDARNVDHENKIKEIAEFMSNFHMSSDYFFNEAKRIKSTGVVLDELRVMAMHAENLKYSNMRKKILECGTIEIPTTKSIWSLPVNNIVINYIKDPENEGVIN